MWLELPMPQARTLALLSLECAAAIQDDPRLPGSGCSLPWPGWRWELRKATACPKLAEDYCLLDAGLASGHHPNQLAAQLLSFLPLCMAAIWPAPLILCYSHCSGWSHSRRARLKSGLHRQYRFEWPWAAAQLCKCWHRENGL